MKSLKVDKFYLIFGAILIVLAVMVIFTLRSAFSAVSVASEIDEGLLEVQTPRINKDKLNKALEALSVKEILPLDLQL